MFLRHGRTNRKCWGIAIVVLASTLLAAPVHAEIDRSLYMSPDEIKPGMKGYGRTVMAGTDIQNFDIEVISVMHNAFYAKQAVILIRCSGLNLDHSGIIGGMSGSPCYIRDDQGRERMIGAVAYGWMFNKDPICGVQPITQMLDVAKVRKPKPESQPAGASKPGASDSPAAQSGGIPLEEWIALAAGEAVPENCRLGAIGRPEPPLPVGKAERAASFQGLRPLEIPLTVSCTSKESLAFLDKRLDRYGLTPVAGGQPGTLAADPDSVRLEPGSALCVAMVSGDMSIEGVGTCTAVIGDQVLGFGHELFGEGTIEMPLATGFIHTVIPSVARSVKLGGALKIVGTLWGDESTAICGVVGRKPTMVPLEIVVNDVRGRQTFHYEIVHEDLLTGTLMATAMLESVFNHSAPPRDHTVRHTIEVDFGELGIHKAGNVTSQRQFSEPVVDLMYSVQTLLNAPLARKAKVRSARAEITVEDTARTASLHEVDLPRTTYKPGETVTASVKWVHYRKAPMYTSASYSLVLPADIPDGDYELTLCSATGQLSALRSEKPHLFRAETLSEALDALNLLGSFSGDRLYMRLNLKRGGLAYKQLEMPDLPGSRRKILSGAGLSGEVSPFSEALVVEHETDFVVNGKYTAEIQVRRHPDQ